MERLVKEDEYRDLKSQFSAVKSEFSSELVALRRHASLLRQLQKTLSTWLNQAPPPRQRPSENFSVPIDQDGTFFYSYFFKNQTTLDDLTRHCEQARAILAHQVGALGRLRQYNTHLQTNIAQLKGQIEGLRVANFKAHLALVQRGSVSLQDLQSLRRLVAPDPFYNDSHFQGTPTHNQQSLMTLAIQAANFGLINALYDFGYSLKASRKLKDNPNALLLDHAAPVTIITALRKELRSTSLINKLIAKHLAGKNPQAMAQDELAIIQALFAKDLAKAHGKLFSDIILQAQTEDSERLTLMKQLYSHYCLFSTIEDTARHRALTLLFKAEPGTQSDTLSDTLACWYRSNSRQREIYATQLLGDLRRGQQEPLGLDIVLSGDYAVFDVTELGDYLFKHYLSIPLTTFTDDTINILSRLLARGYAKNHSQALSNIILNAPMSEQTRFTQCDTFLTSYCSITKLDDTQRHHALKILFSELSTQQAQINTLKRWYATQRGIDAILLLRDLNNLGKKALGLELLTSGEVSVEHFNDEIFSLAISAYSQNKPQLLRRAMNENGTFVQTRFNELEQSPDSAEERVLLIQLKPSLFTHNNYVLAFSELNLDQAQDGFAFNQVMINNQVEITQREKLTLLYAKSVFEKHIDEDALLDTIAQYQQDWQDLGFSQASTELMLKYAKNALLQLAINKADYQANQRTKDFMATHRTKGWTVNLCCLSFTIPPTLLSTPSSDAYDAIVANKYSKAQQKLDRQVEKAQQTWQRLSNI